MIANSANDHTKLYGLLGYPLGYTLSPRLHNAALAARGLNGVYLSFPVVPDDLAAAVAGLKALGAGGFNITIPHKEKILPLLDAVSPHAARLGAVNTVRNDDGKLIGYNTDGTGFWRALHGARLPNRYRHALILGAGGAARAVAFRLAEERPVLMTVANRTIARAEALTRDLRKAYGEAVQIQAVGLDYNTLISLAPSIDLVVSAIPSSPEAEAAVLCKALPPHCVVYDLVYSPPETPLLREAAHAGLRTLNGLGMLVYQAAEAFSLWTGQAAPLAAMGAAVGMKAEGTE